MRVLFLAFSGQLARTSTAAIVRSQLATSSLKIQTGTESSYGQLIFGDDGDHNFMFKVESNGLLCLQNNETKFLEVDPTQSTISVKANTLTITNTLDIMGDLRIAGIAQWKLFHKADFQRDTLEDWDNADMDMITQCAGLFMLGGYGKFGMGEIARIYGGIPEHSELRVVATFHFIDRWSGETAFMRLNIGKDGSMIHVWTDRHSQNSLKNGINVCGSQVPEGKFSSYIDVTIPHVADNLKLGFGTTMTENDPLDASWGVSYIEIYIR